MHAERCTPLCTIRDTRGSPDDSNCSIARECAGVMLLNVRSDGEKAKGCPWTKAPTCALGGFLVLIRIVTYSFQVLGGGTALRIPCITPSWIRCQLSSASIVQQSSSEFRNSLGRYAGDASGMHSFPVRVALRMRTLRSLATAKVSFATNGSGAEGGGRSVPEALRATLNRALFEDSVGFCWSVFSQLLLR